MSIFESARFALQSSVSLFNDKSHYASVRRRPLLFELASTPQREPFNREEVLLQKFVSIAQQRNLNDSHDKRGRYWAEEKPYDLTEVFGTCVQFIDQHEAPLPRTTLPPSQDIERFINGVLIQDHPVTIDREFEMLLDITGDSLVGAANVGMLATRYMSRFSDIRAYPCLNIDGTTVTPHTDDETISNIMRSWNAKVARFETYSNGRNDGTGDQYYFWTHFFAACVADNESVKGKIFQKSFERGNEIMIFAKDRIAKRGGVVSSHYEASLLGRNIGLALVFGEASTQGEIFPVRSKTPEVIQDEQSAWHRVFQHR